MTTLRITADGNGTLVPSYSKAITPGISQLHLRDSPAFRHRQHHRVDGPAVVLKLADSVGIAGTSPSLFSPGNPFLPSLKPKDEEIGVFGAEKYFKGEDDGQLRLGILSPRVYKPVTPSRSSESSANSQAALLRSHQPRTEPRPNGKRQKNRIVFMGCPCSGMKSVRTDDVKVQETRKPIFDIRSGYTESLSKRIVLGISDPADRILKLPPELLLRSGRFERARKETGTFPTANLPGKIPAKVGSDVQKPRISIEVFRSEDVGPRVSSGRRLSSRRADVVSPGAGPRDDDAASDASSDLFELDVVSSQVGSYLRRAMSSTASPSCYEPSEASIEWSVATASMADGSELVGRLSGADGRGMGLGLGSGPGLPIPEGANKRRPSLLGCRSERAVNIAADSLIKPPADKCGPCLEPLQAQPYHPKPVNVL
ncbi:protein PHYTOCHROME KINASE SUBSTRATE 4 [Nymphaea colorata]|uniref:protein PHYTOCHROME KINASE SUBSTRATE 4 n=1 Tax=Nymphaea colorata TaxID=210225 RepID=UPI00129DE84C|nr:protein PHYTOCHROME KINASE SUBSTRATE 4 [Nymphaea colorata]